MSEEEGYKVIVKDIIGSIKSLYETAKIHMNHEIRNCKCQKMSKIVDQGLLCPF